MTKPIGSVDGREFTHAEDLLARAYLQNLREAEGVRGISLFAGKQNDDTMAGILAELEELEPEDDDSPRLRADLAATAILLARAVAGEPGLAKRLRRENPVVSIRTHTSDLVDLVETVVKSCALGGSSQRKHVVARDGSKTTDKPDRGNADIVEMINRKGAVVGIAPDPMKHLPSALMRMTEYRLSLPGLDEATVRLVLEAVTGKTFKGRIDPNLVRLADFSDLLMSFRGGLGPEECLENLKKVVDSRGEFHGDGPGLVDLDGYGEARDWGLDLSLDIADYKVGRLSWSEFDRKGLLLSGPPGTGKTQFAQALAKTCGVPLIATSVAQWNAVGHLGDTLKAIRDVFGRAKRSAPSVLFIDEIDGISSRERLSGDYVEYWSQIVNLLLEMVAGIEDREGVVIVAATNHPAKIDPALMRAGRLDQHIAIEKPDPTTFAKILRHHLGPDFLAGADLMPVALSARGGTGADAEAFVRRARAAARRARRNMTVEDLLLQVREGRPAMPAAVRDRAAIHEAGHVVAGSLLEGKMLVGVSLHAEGGTTEFKINIDGASTQAAIEDEIVIALAGRAAEGLVLGDVSVGSGAHLNSDLGKATSLAVLLETACGFGTFGPVLLDTASNADLLRHPLLLAAVKGRVEAAEQRARALLSAHLRELTAVAEALKVSGYLSAEEIGAVLQALPPGETEERASGASSAPEKPK